MAKSHKWSTVSLQVGGKPMTIKDQKVKLRYQLEYSAKHDGAAVSTDYTNTFDLEMSFMRMLELAKNSITIAWQNKVLRPLTEDKARKYNHEVITYDMVFPGTRTSVVRDMTPEQIVAKAKTDKDFRAQLLRELEGLEDDNE